MEEWVQEFDNREIMEKAKIDWLITLDFKVQSKFIVDDLRTLLIEIETVNDEKSLSISQHCFNLLSWINQMEIMGFLSLKDAVQRLLKDEFGNKDIIDDLQQRSFDKWIVGKHGQYKIGENYYNINKNKVYYRNLQANWHLISSKNVFCVMPTSESIPDHSTIKKLERDYHPTELDKIFSEWKNLQFKNEIPQSLFRVQEGETTPEDNFQSTLEKIKEIIASPVSYKQIKELNSKGEDYLEYLMKLSILMGEFVQTRRDSDEHTVYLLRDCLIFYEIQKTLDFLENKETSCDQLFIGRKLLSNKIREGGYWYFAQEALFFAYQKYPNSFEKFYTEYSRILKEYANYNKDFPNFLKEVAEYINKHIENAKSNNLKIAIVDLGFQGSINMFIKYIVDNYCSNGIKLKTDIHMYVLAEWFKSVYKNRYTSKNYSILTAIEVLSRNEYLYDYKKGSFDEGKLAVIMGNRNDQINADLELLIITMTIILTKQLRII